MRELCGSLGDSCASFVYIPSALSLIWKIRTTSRLLVTIWMSKCFYNMRPMSQLRFYRAILSRNFIARQSWITQLCMSYTSILSHKQDDQSAWSVLVYATKLQCATCTVAYCNFVARKRCATNSRAKIAGVTSVWHFQPLYVTFASITVKVILYGQCNMEEYYYSALDRLLALCQQNCKSFML